MKRLSLTAALAAFALFTIRWTANAQRPQPDGLSIQKPKTSIESPRADDPISLRPMVIDFQIPSPNNGTEMGFPLKGTGLYSAEIRFECDPASAPHGLWLSFRSGTRPPGAQRRPGDFHDWFGNNLILHPLTSYRFYFWVDEEMLRQLPDDRTLRLVLARTDTVRERLEGEWEARHLVRITLPGMVGRVHVRPPNPIEVQALPGDQSPAISQTLLHTDIVQYRVNASFPWLEGRMKPFAFKAEFRVPVSRGVHNKDIGGFLLRGGRWRSQSVPIPAGTYDYLASPSTEFSHDANGRRFPREEDWTSFRTNGLLFAIDQARQVRVAPRFYLTGGEIPPSYWVAELETVRLSKTPDEGDRSFWLNVNSVAALRWQEAAPAGNNPFAVPRTIPQVLLQSLWTRMPFPRSGDNQGFMAPRLPLMATTVNTLTGKDSLDIVSNHYYSHNMSVAEEAGFILKSTEAGQIIESLVEQDAGKFLNGLIGWIVKAGQQQNPDLYRSFGVDTFTTDANRGWAVKHSPERFEVRGAASGDTTTNDVIGTTGRSVAETSDITSNNHEENTHTAGIRVRTVPGVFVDGARIKVLNVKTKRHFEGEIKIVAGIIGHGGGRTRTSGQGLAMESTAVGTPFSYWADKIAARGPFDLREGESRAIDFPTIDFGVAEHDFDGLWEQLHYTFGPWAGLHLQLALINVERMDGHGPLSPRKVTAVHYKDIGYLTVYPWDQLYDPIYGRLKNNIERDGDWVILRGRMEPRGEILDEAEIEIRLKVQARDTGPMVHVSTQNQ